MEKPFRATSFVQLRNCFSESGPSLNHDGCFYLCDESPVGGEAVEYSEDYKGETFAILHVFNFFPTYFSLQYFGT